MKSLKDIEKLVKDYFKNLHHRGDKTVIPQGFKKAVKESFPSILGRIPFGGYATGYYRMNTGVDVRRGDPLSENGFSVRVDGIAQYALDQKPLMRIYVTYVFTPRKTKVYLSIEGPRFKVGRSVYGPKFDMPGVFTAEKMEQTLFKMRKFINDKLAEPGLFGGLQLYQITPLKGLKQKFNHFCKYYGFDIELEAWGGKLEFSPNTALEFKGNEHDLNRIFVFAETKNIFGSPKLYYYDDPALIVQKNIVKGMKYVFDKEEFDASKVKIGQYGNMLLGHKGSYRRDSGVIIDDDGDKYFLSFIDPEPRNYRKQKTPILGLPFTWYIRKGEVEEKFIPLQNPIDVCKKYTHGKMHANSISPDMKLLMTNWYIGHIKKYVANHVYTSRKVLKQRWTGDKELSNELASRYINIHERQLPFTMSQQEKKQRKGNEVNWLVQLKNKTIIFRCYLSLGSCYRVTLETTAYSTYTSYVYWKTKISITIEDTSNCRSFSKKPIHIIQEAPSSTIGDTLKWVSSELFKRLDWTKNPRGLLTGYPFWMIRERALANVYGKDTVPVDKNGNSFFKLSKVRLKSFFKSYFKKYFPNAEYDMFGELFIIPKNKEAVKMLKTVFTEVPKNMAVKPQNVKITAKNYWETHARRRAENFMFRFAPHFPIGDYGATVLIKHAQVDQMVQDLTKFIKEKVK